MDLGSIMLMHHQVVKGGCDSLFVTHAHLTHDFSVDCIIDNGLQKKLIVKAIIDKLHLPIDPHPHPYSLGWKDNESSA